MLLYHLIHCFYKYLLASLDDSVAWFAVPALCLSPKHTNDRRINCLCLDMFCFPAV